MFIAISILAAVASSQGTTSYTCDKSNAFRYLLNPSLVVQSSAHLVTGYCGDEWQRFGSCCHLVKVLEAADADKRKIEESYRMLVREFADFLPKYKEFMGTLLRLETLEASSWKQQGINPVNFVRYLAGPVIRRNYDFVINNSNEAGVAAYNKEMEDCWNYNIKLRGSTVCTTCSARGYLFFQEGMALAGSEACQPIIDICSAPIKKTIILFRLWYGLVIKWDKRFGKVTSPETNVLSKLHRYVGLFKSQTLMKYSNSILNTDEDFKTLIESSSAHKNEFCNRFVKLAGDPFIVKITSKFNSQVPWKLEISPAIKSFIDAQTLNPRSRPLSREAKSRNRFLDYLSSQGKTRQLHSFGFNRGQSADQNLNSDSEDNLFRSDVKWSFTSENSAIERGSSFENTVRTNLARVINLTLSFP